MKEDEIREGDIVEIDYITEFTQEHYNEGKALVLWKGINHQPLIMRLKGEYSPSWSTYYNIGRVIGHISLGKILKEQVEKSIKELEDGDQNDSN